MFLAVIVLIVFLFGFRLLLVKSFGSLSPEDEEDLDGKIVLITGANGGLGKATSLGIAKRGGIVLMACRQMSSATQSIKEIRRVTSRGELIPLHLDLASFASIREMCTEVQNRFERIDILINNAGVLISKDKSLKTVEGHEINMGTNHLGHFLLTNLLLPLIKESSYGRIVTVGSISYKQAILDLADINSQKWIESGEREFGLIGQNRVYANSKLANFLFSFQLSEILRREKSHVKTYACCPGIVQTEISRHLSIPSFLHLFKNIVESYFFKSCVQGSETILYCALSKKLRNHSGRMYQHCRDWNDDYHFPDDLIVTGKRKELSLIEAKKLWDLSIRLTKL